MVSKKGMDEYSILTEMCTMGSGRMIELMGMECLKTLQELGMKESGKWTSSMATVKKFLRKRDRFMKESFMKVKSMDKESLNGEMEVTTKGTLLMESMKDEDCTILPTKEGNTKESS